MESYIECYSMRFNQQLHLFCSQLYIIYQKLQKIKEPFYSKRKKFRIY